MHKHILLNTKINEITAEIKRWMNEIDCITNYIREFPENSDCVPLKCLVEKYRKFAQEKVAEFHRIRAEFNRLPAPLPLPPIYPMSPRANGIQLPACPKIPCDQSSQESLLLLADIASRLS